MDRERERDVMEQDGSEQMSGDETAVGGPGRSPGDLLRALPGEARQRGSQYVSAQAMQARLFSVYDAAAAAEDALALVQQQLTLTLHRSYYEAEEITAMAGQLDALLVADAVMAAADGSSED